MADLKKGKRETQLIQNMEMAIKSLKMTKLSLNVSNVNIDILDKLLGMKDNVKELLDIVIEHLVKRRKNSIGTNTLDKEIHDEIETSQQSGIDTEKRYVFGNDEVNKKVSHLHIVECNLCDKKFKIVSDLEKHVKNEHKEYKSHKCDECDKEFVTGWRLKKHLILHKERNIKHCKYFVSDEFCPFDELGCKFRHSETIKLENADNDTAKVDFKDLKDRSDDNSKDISEDKYPNKQKNSSNDDMEDIEVDKVEDIEVAHGNVIKGDITFEDKGDDMRIMMMSDHNNDTLIFLTSTPKKPRSSGLGH